MSFATNGTLVICRDCGLTMSNGFCLHGSVDSVLAAKHVKRVRLPKTRRENHA